MFAWEFCEITKNTFFTEHLWTTASVYYRQLFLYSCAPHELQSICNQNSNLHHIFSFNQIQSMHWPWYQSLECEYLGLLEPLRHLIKDLSSEKHIKVLTLFVTIEIGTFRLFAKLSVLTECINFLFRHLQQRPGEWRTRFQFATLDYHSFFSFHFYLLWRTSQLPSYYVSEQRD